MTVNVQSYKYFGGARTHLGGGKELFFNPLTHRASIITRDVSQLASSCTEFSSVEEHARRIMGKITSTSEVSDKLQQAVREGLLVSLEQVRDRVLAGLSARATRHEISTIGVPTRNRPDMLRRLLASLATQLRQFGHRCQIVIVDDSESVAMQDANRKVIETYEDDKDLSCIRYDNRETRREYAAQISKESGVAQHIVMFCISACDDYSVSVGACRNTILLRTLGEHILYLDDDVLCKTALLPEAESQLRFTGGLDSLDAWFFSNPDDGHNIECVEEDIIKLHEDILNIERSTLAQMDSERIEFASIAPGFLERVQDGTGVPIISSIGLVGDTAIDYPTQYFLLSRETLGRLTASPKIYRDALTNRAVIRGYRRPTLAEHLPCMSYCMGVDNRELLPPFLPVQRAEELVFGALISQCIPGALFGAIPRAIFHRPAMPRRFEPGAEMGRLGRFMVAEIIAALCNVDGVRGVSRKASVEILSTWFGELACCGEVEFKRHIRKALGPVFCFLIERLDAALQYDVTGGSFWKEDVLRMKMRAYTTWNGNDCTIPLDLERQFGLSEGQRRFRDLLLQFSKALGAWPRIVEVAAGTRGN